MAAANRARSRVRHALLLSTIVFTATCGGTTDTGGDNGQVVTIPVNLSVTPNPITNARQGFSVNATVNFTRTTSSTAPLTLSVTGLSNGVTATFNPATLTTVSGTSQLTITASATAPPATDTLIITARGVETGGHLEVGTVGVNAIIGMPQINVSRNGTGSGTVTSSPAGINCGSTCSAPFAYGTTVTLTATPAQGSAFDSWSGGCSGTTPTCTATSGSTPSAIANFNSTAPSFSMAVTPIALTVAQGTVGTATVTLTRNNGFAGSVNLAASGAPQGLTVTPNPASITGTNSTLNVAASLSLAAGSYPVTLTATGTGVTQQTATLTVQVTPAQGGNGNVSMSFASCDPTAVPIWFAVQSGNGPWTRMTAGANGSFTFTPGATGGIAFVQQFGTDFSTQILYGTASEITAIATGPGPCFLDGQTGTKRVNGTISHASTTVAPTVAIGGAQTTLTPPNAGFSLFSVPAGKRDAAATLVATNNGLNFLQRMVLRRNVNYGNNANAPDFDFIGAESFAPVFHRIFLDNVAGDQIAGSLDFVTTNGMLPSYFSTNGTFFSGFGRDGVGLYAIPDSLLQPGDFHVASAFVIAADGNSARIAEWTAHSLADQSIALGPPLSTPTVTTVGTSPYLRLRAQLPSQSAYESAVSADYDQGTNSLSVGATAAYFGGMPSTWVLDVPDLSSAGYDASWGLRTGTVSWQVVALHGDVLSFVGGPMFDGALLVGALRANSAATFNALRARRQGVFPTRGKSGSR